ncbi:MAG: glycerol-3-phosphate 1-O-acyltransferase PlsY [Gemmatimonadota bacterium]|nr:glycerol-3-phosphate 1-O-acyltransferase PlsY [Gemmatimonadota bacterium]
MVPIHVPIALAVVIAYVAGSIPSAYLAGKWRGVDLRAHGSGNLGATNVVRVLGIRIGAMVFVVDTLKGFLPVFFLPQLTGSTHPEIVSLAVGGAAILGHVRPVFLLGQKGGKGVATAGGVFLGVAWLPAIIAFAVWIVVFATSRYVSVASLSAALALPFAFFLTGSRLTDWYLVASAVVALFVFFTHRANIARLRRGEEHRFVRGAGADGATPAPRTPPRHPTQAS